MKRSPKSIAKYKKVRHRKGSVIALSSCRFRVGRGKGEKGVRACVRTRTCTLGASMELEGRPRAG